MSDRLLTDSESDPAASETIEEKAKRIGVPVLGGNGVTERVTSPDPIIGLCGQCGIEIRNVMHYSCPNHTCQIFKKTWM